ncbi:MAG: hypothetical protein AAGC44_11175 [Planctomycetota bacterium]
MRRSHLMLSLVLLLLVGSALGQNAEREAEARARLLAQAQQMRVQLQAQNVEVELVEAQAEAAGLNAQLTQEAPSDNASQPNTQPLPEPVIPDQPAPPGTMRFYLMDGSVLTGTLAVDTIPIKTEFGDLVVPIESIERFAPGLQSHPELQAKIAALIEQLAHRDAGRRDAAQSQLVGFGPGLIEELRGYLGTDDAEQKLRLEAVLEALYEQQMDPMSEIGDNNQPKPSLVRLDEIETQSFTMAGQITQEAFQIQSKFGKLDVALGDIMSAQKLTTSVPEVRRSLEVSGRDFAGINYKNTGIRINRGDRVVIQADGQITMSPWGRNTVTGPDGMPQNGNYAGNIPMGALCGKIGDGGDEMLIGSRSNFVAQRAGTLYLGFAMQSNWTNQNFPGKFNVRVRVVPAAQ